jgi:hypothetical protein
MIPEPLIFWESLALFEAGLEPPDLAGPHHEAVEQGAGEAIRQGGAVLLELGRRALTRHLGTGHRHLAGLFSADEVLLLAEAIERALAAGESLARLLLLDRMHGVARRELGARESRLTEATFLPHAALDFFRGLLGLLGTDPQRQGPTLARRAFTLAVATGQELLTKVQDAIAERIASGQMTSGPRAVAELLKAAGVSPRNPQYAEAVFRTNYLDSFNQTYQDELSASADTFPVWKYSNPDDSRSRPTHAARNGQYYPSSVPFTYVRGTTAKDVINCRCLPIAVDKWTWKELRDKGARLADGYQEAPAPGLRR